ncbi:MAG TPA: DUF1552 domain-containing protein [Pirellulales bacterium]
MAAPDRRISRRAVLRGAGAALTLPWLDGLAPRAVRAAESAAVKPPVRAAFLFFPNGVWRDRWIPKETGKEYRLPFSLEPLSGVKDSVLVLSGMDKAHSRDGDGHYAKTANFLTGMHVEKTTGKSINTGGVSIDQLAAQKIGGQTPLPSLELGIDPVISGIDSNVGYTRLYGSYISWKSPTQPVAKEINPRMVYERMFGSSDGPLRDPDNLNLLDLVLDDAKSLREKLGRDDQFKLDEYLDSINAVEARIKYASNSGSRSWTPPSTPGAIPSPKPGVPGDFREHVDLMFELMFLAFWTDSTRIASFMFANDVSGRNFSFLDGVHGGHHELSHHEGKQEKLEQYSRINRWHVEVFAKLLDKMRNVKEGESTLLDNSMILMGCGMSDGNSHDPNNLPILLGGKGGGTINSGRHIQSEKGTPLCNLYATMLDKLGVPVERFGDSTKPLDLS